MSNDGNNKAIGMPIKEGFKCVAVGIYASGATPTATIMYPDGLYQPMSKDILQTIVSNANDPRTKACTDALDIMRLLYS